MTQSTHASTRSLFEPALAEIRSLAFDSQHASPTQFLKTAMEIIAGFRPDSYWTGIYVLKGDELHVGPYVGPVTEHTRIPVGKGVCGTAVAENKNQIVADVNAIENYLACNIFTKSEIVVLIRDQKSRKILGQIDIDSTVKNAFSKDDERVLEEIAEVLAPFLTD